MVTVKSRASNRAMRDELVAGDVDAGKDGSERIVAHYLVYALLGLAPCRVRNE